MGCDSTNVLPSNAKRKDVEEFVRILGYKKEPYNYSSHKKATTFYFYREENYKYVSGIRADIFLNDNKNLCIDIHTSIWRSGYDSDFHNWTIKQLKKRFGGFFVSDYGKNRYLKFNGAYREDEEGGCYKSYFNFEDNIQRIKFAIKIINNPKFSFFKGKISKLKKVANNEFIRSSPNIVISNISISFLVSIIETYFRASYISLLTYSPKKDKILNNINPRLIDLYALSSGQLRVEEAAARTISFQNLNSISKRFKELNNKIDISKIMKNRYKNRKETTLQSIERLIQQRHDLIHRSIINPNYSPSSALKDIEIMEKSIEKFYKTLIKVYSWNPYEY